MINSASSPLTTTSNHFIPYNIQDELHWSDHRLARGPPEVRDQTEKSGDRQKDRSGALTGELGVEDSEGGPSQGALLDGK